MNNANTVYLAITNRLTTDIAVDYDTNDLDMIRAISDVAYDYVMTYLTDGLSDNDLAAFFDGGSYGALLELTISLGTGDFDGDSVDNVE